tara:strand:- start:6 stop:977 length:972 start_codon:yes stop_codon:yes gene_type:complete
MKNIVAIIAGEPNSISSEIIFKSFKLKKKLRYNNFFIIGNIELFKKQKNKLKLSLKINEINANFTSGDLKKNGIPIFNVKYHQKKPFEKISNKSNKYIFKCFEQALHLIRKRKITGIINCPISKKFLLKKNFNGITEFLSKRAKVYGNEVMLLYNKKLSVAPLTTHIPIKKVSQKINKKIIIKKIKTINIFYKKNLKKTPIIGILGLNPHNSEIETNSEENKIIIPAIKILKKSKIKAIGPLSPDSSFAVYKKHKLDVILGMYHDQVLTAYKAIFNLDAINITLGLPYIRISPDHGVGEDIVGKNKANPKSLIESMNFFKNIK